MAVVYTLQIGVPQILAVEDEVWAMPVRRCIGFVNPVTTVLEVSDAVAGTFVAVDIDVSDGRFETAAPFIRNGGAPDCTVLMKAD